ncbi:MAG: S8 family peptidase [Pseudomonadota bacterium]
MKQSTEVSNFVRRSITAVLVATAAGAMAQPAPQAAARVTTRGDAVPGQYIVVLKESAPSGTSAAEVLAGSGGMLHRSFAHALRGFSAVLSLETVEHLRRHPFVAYVEQDRIFTSADVQSAPVWNLDRIDQANLPIDSYYTYERKGGGSYGFVVDTGVYPDHAEFTGRVLPGVTFVLQEPPVDFSGHGTHVTGTIGAITYGVAKDVSLVPVKVLNRFGQGETSAVLAGLEWVAERTDLRPGVLNMSLSGPLSQAVNDAVANVVQAGVTVVVAAGNDGRDACLGSPASAPGAVVVGATDKEDAKAWFSNYGPCVTLFAPGVDVLSTWIPVPPRGESFPDGIPLVSMSGTSMAGPHVTGQVATLLQAFPGATPAWVRNHLIQSATVGRVSGAGEGSPNRLLYTRAPVYGASVKSLTSQAIGVKNKWNADVSVSVQDRALGQPLGGALVKGIFAPGGEVSCVTTAAGNCVVNAASLPRSTSQTRFTVTEISGWNLGYTPGLNAATQLVVLKPED